MARKKLKTLLIYKYLKDFSDEDNPLSSTELINMLQADGIEAERKSIYADIKSLNSIGFEIEKTNSPHKGFYMSKRDFELPEVRLLIDAVSSAGFITPKKTEKLIGKLESLVSKNQAGELVSQVYLDNNTKCNNEDIYYIINDLHNAINEKHKVKFVYTNRKIDIKNKKSYTEKTFVVSPYALLWKEDHYYLVCNNEKYDNLINLRIDRMKRVQELSEASRPVSEVSEYKNTFDVADYSSKMFNMFSGKDEKVRLLCDLELREQIMDRIGAKIPLTAYDSSHFETTIDAAVSEGLVSWLMIFGDKIKVLEPDALANAVKDRASKIAKIYE